MDVKDSYLQKEVDMLKSLQKKRAQEHSEEVNNLRQKQKAQIEDLEKNQLQSMTRIQSKNKEILDQTQQRYADNLTDIQDQYEKTLKEERNENYNRFGKMSYENALEKSRSDNIKNQQLLDLEKSMKRDIHSDRKAAEQAASNIRNQYEQQKVENQKYFDQKIKEQTLASNQALTQKSVESRQKTDDIIRRSQEENYKNRQEHQMRLQQRDHLANSQNDAQKKAFKARVEQLEQEKDLLQQKTTQDYSTTFKQYRDRSSEALKRVTEDSNARQQQTNAKHAGELRDTHLEHQDKLQTLSTLAQKRENDLQHKLGLEKEQSYLKQDLSQQRAELASHTQAEAARLNQIENESRLKEHQAANMTRLEEKFRKENDKIAQQARDQIARNDFQTSYERAQHQSEKAKALRETEAQHGREKHVMTQSFQAENQALEDLRKRQLDGMQQDYVKRQNESKKQQDRKIAAMQRDHQKEMTFKRLQSENESASQTEQLKADLKFEKTLQERRAAKLAQSYQNALMNTQEHFEETTEELKHAKDIEKHEIRSEGDHEKRLQLMELQTRHRMTIYDYELKMDELKANYEKEIENLKSAHKKDLQLQQRQIKEGIEQAQRNHARDMASKEAQSENRLKIQEKYYKEQIEKLKRSHELSLKKS